MSRRRKRAAIRIPALAKQIDLLQKYSPGITGIDAFFERKDDSYASFKLDSSLAQHNNIVIGSSFIDTPESVTSNYFESMGHHYDAGYCNFLGNESYFLE